MDAFTSGHSIIGIKTRRRLNLDRMIETLEVDQFIRL